MFETTINNTNIHNGCPHRLPCGYCVSLGGDCPRQAATTANLASSSDSTSRAALDKLEG